MSCILLAQFCAQNVLLSYVGKNTLTIFALHLAALSVIKAVVFLVLHVDRANLINNIPYNVVLAIVAIITLLPVAYVLNRYFPYLIGKPLKKAVPQMELALR